MRKLTKYYMLSFLLSTFVISSCTKDEITGDGNGNVIESEGYLAMSELAENPVNLTAEQGTYILKVISDKEWTATVSCKNNDGSQVEKADEWCILSSKTGINASEIYIGFSKNKWNIARSASVDFSFEGSDEKYSLALNQEAAETVYEFVSDDIKENGLTFKKSGQTYKVNLVTNAYQWTVSLVGEDDQPVTWCSLNQSEDGVFSGKGDKELTITAVENEYEVENRAFLKFISLETTFDNKLSLTQNAELLPFEGLKYEIVDDGANFNFNWIDETAGATYNLILAKDENYSEIIDEISYTTTDGNLYSVDLSNKFNSYIGTVYAKLECNDPINNEQAIIEKTFNSHFSVESGDGSEGAPYIISNARHLKNIEKITDSGKIFKQTKDIDLNNVAFTALCVTDGFNNTFDGGNFKISNLNIGQSNTANVGLFSKINGTGVVKNLKLDNVSIVGGENVGGFVGLCEGQVTNCQVSSGVVTGEKYIGGIIGSLKSTELISNCINKATVQSTNNIEKIGVGGIVGNNLILGSQIKTSGNEGEVKAIGTNCTGIGGIVGFNDGGKMTVEQCYNKGKITAGNTEVGGICGMSPKTIIITDCYNTGYINATLKELRIAGIIGTSGNASTAITNCYNIGKTEKTTTPPVLGSAITFGHASTKTVIITNCFGIETSSQKICSDGKAIVTGSELKSEEEMKNQSTYTGAGWDFTNVWTMSAGGYPKLKWEE